MRVSDALTYIKPSFERYNTDYFMSNIDDPTHTANDSYVWIKNDDYHRDKGPAIITRFGKAWFKNGQLHRDNEPAVVLYNGDCDWYSDGNFIKTNNLHGTRILFCCQKYNPHLQPVKIEGTCIIA